MTFAQEGFYSAEIDKFRTRVRSTEPSKLWFDYALDLVRIGFKMLGPLETSLSDERLLYLKRCLCQGTPDVPKRAGARRARPHQ